VRSTPRRISFGPSSVLTVTCRPRISRVDIGVSVLLSRYGKDHQREKVSGCDTSTRTSSDSSRTG
jgi:hypothetical protein